MIFPENAKKWCSTCCKCYQTIDALFKSGTRCYQLSKETSELCHTTQAKDHGIIAFESNIETTLTISGYHQGLNGRDMLRG
jgi:hypothetical protein